METSQKPLKKTNIEETPIDWIWVVSLLKCNSKSVVLIEDLRLLQSGAREFQQSLPRSQESSGVELCGVFRKDCARRTGNKTTSPEGDLISS